MRQRVRGKGPSHIARGGQRQASTATTILIVDTAQPIVNETTQEKSWWIIPHHATALRVYDRDTSMSHSHTAQVRNRTCILCSSFPRALAPWSGLKNHWKFTCTIFLRLASDYLSRSTRPSMNFWGDFHQHYAHATQCPNVCTWFLCYWITWLVTFLVSNTFPVKHMSTGQPSLFSCRAKTPFHMNLCICSHFPYSSIF